MSEMNKDGLFRLLAGGANKDQGMLDFWWRK
jgi:hypothetical protein